LLKQACFTSKKVGSNPKHPVVHAANVRVHAIPHDLPHDSHHEKETVVML